MNELDSKARALLQATQGADDPSQDDYDRVHRAVLARLAVGAAAGVAVTTVTKTAGAAAGASTAGASAGATAVAASFPLLKVVAWVAVASMTVGTGAVVLSKTSAETSRPPVTAPPPARAPLASPVSSPPATHPTAAPDRVFVSTPVESTPPTPAVNPPPGASTRRDVPASPVSSSASLEAEVRLIRDARAALAHGDASHALALLDDHARLFPDGAMAQDRDALQVFATCASGETDAARELAARFLARHPSSSYASTVRASCAKATTP